jgi:hypothetical protein
MSNGNGVCRGDRDRKARVESASRAGAGDARDRGDRSGRYQADGGCHRSRLEGAGAADVSLPGVGSGVGVGVAGQQAKAGFAGVTAACEPPGHRWRVLGQLAADRARAFVRVQTLRPRRSARSSRSVTCWNGCGRRRWTRPSSHSATRIWLAGMSVILARTGGDPARSRHLGPDRFEAAVRREVVARQGKKPCLRIVRLLFATAVDPRAVTSHRNGALERVQLLADDFRDTGPAWARPRPAWSQF